MLSLCEGAGLVQALREASYEILPIRGVEESVVAHVPRDVPLTVTTAERMGIDPTVDLAVRLRKHGYRTAPHLAARNLRDDAHLSDVVARLRDGGVDAAVVVGGDAAEPAGSFPDALTLLEHLDAIGHPFRSISIGGYPEGHARIEPSLLEEALTRKAAHATRVITQLCFHAPTTVDWARRVKRLGMNLPIRVGIPGAVNRQKLIRISAGLGLGQSARFLARQQSLFWRFLLPGGYRPDRLVRRLGPNLGQPDQNLQGLHVFTFNELARTEAWRLEWIDRLAEAGP